MSDPDSYRFGLWCQKVEAQANGCWAWTGAQFELGYGSFRDDGRKQVRAYRYAWEFFIGPIPEGLTIDHLCRNPNCVNPTHLEPVTMRENTLRGIGPSAINSRRTHCASGHPLAGDNLYLNPISGRRDCLICRRANGRQYVKRKREERYKAAFEAGLDRAIEVLEKIVQHLPTNDALTAVEYARNRVAALKEAK